MENLINYDIEDFIGVFENAYTKEFCNEVISHYDYLNKWNKTVSRQTSENIPDIFKKTDQYSFDNETDPTILETNSRLGLEFTTTFWKCYALYSQQYGILSSVGVHKLSNILKLQKTQPSGGYHVWHCEHDSGEFGRRLMLALLYLNDVEDGGETEFLYQSRRIKPKQGTLIICPSSYTHTHRGNPPLSGDKYVMNTWVEYN